MSFFFLLHQNCRNGREAATLFMSLHRERWSKRKKTNNPMTKKSIPKGEGRCSNCQVESDEREKKKNPNKRRYRDFWVVWGLKPRVEHAASNASDTVTTRLWTNVESNQRGKLHSDRRVDTQRFHFTKTNNPLGLLSVVEVNGGE